MCFCMLMHATMDHGGQQSMSAPPAPMARSGEGQYPAGQDARALLDERYARGDIDRQDYLQRREDLSR